MDRMSPMYGMQSMGKRRPMKSMAAQTEATQTTPPPTKQTSSTIRTRTRRSDALYAPRCVKTTAMLKVRHGELLPTPLTSAELRDDLQRPGDERLLDYIDKTNDIFTGVRQTADAVGDSRTLTMISEIAKRKVNSSVRDDASNSLDMDEFVSKCITFMRLGGPPHDDEELGPRSTARGRRQAAFAGGDDDDDDMVGSALDWAVLGANACFPTNTRPPVPGFLLGPLSVQRPVRNSQKRTQRSQRQPVGPTVKPQELQHSDIQRSDANNVTHIVQGIMQRMEKHIHLSTEAIIEELPDEADDASFVAACHGKRIRATKEREPAVSLFDFALNPSSFGQSVENLFYVSFLIREGRVKVDKDKDGLPLLCECVRSSAGCTADGMQGPINPREVQEQREQNVAQHQAVFSLDWSTWKQLVEAFDIEEPLIPHRVSESATVTERGWYG